MTKTMSFAAVHFTVAFTVGYLLSGSVLVGGAIALVEPAVNTVAYHFHEKAWNRFKRVDQASTRRVVHHAF
jgi:uncharacterized membrane protein